MGSLIDKYLMEKHGISEVSVKDKKGKKQKAADNNTFITTGNTDDNETDKIMWMINEISPELFAHFTDDERREIIIKIMSNKLILFNFKEFLVGKKIQGGASGGGTSTLPTFGIAKRSNMLYRPERKRNPSGNQSHNRSNVSNGLSQINEKSYYSSSRVRIEERGRGFSQVNRTADQIVNDEDRLATIHSSKPSYSRNVSANMDSFNHKGDDSENAITINLLKKRKILQYLIKKSEPPAPKPDLEY